MTGSYVLIIELSEPAEIEVGALGRVDFAAGGYAYVGSAMGGLEARIERHLRDDKRLHWHVDYLLERALVVQVLRLESTDRTECAIARELATRLDAVPDFGCSDCACASHLFFAPELDAVREAAQRAVAATARACSDH